MEKLEKLMEYDGKVFTSPIYNSNQSMKQLYNIKNLKTKFEKKYKELIQEKTKTKTKTKKSPNELAKEYDIGYKKHSTNDNNFWIVSVNKNGVKRWIKSKE